MKYIIHPQSADSKKIVVIGIAPGMAAEQVSAKDIPDGLPFSIVDSINIDSDFFEAYEYSGGKAVFNSDSAKEIQKNRWRVARNKLLSSLDVDYMKTLEKGDSTTAKQIAGKKQALRDVTDTEIPGTTPKKIRSAWPEILGENPYA